MLAFRRNAFRGWVSINEDTIVSFPPHSQLKSALKGQYAMQSFTVNQEGVNEYSNDHVEKAKCVVDQAQAQQAKENMKQSWYEVQCRNGNLFLQGEADRA
jgi:hypothetical protein